MAPLMLFDKIITLTVRDPDRNVHLCVLLLLLSVCVHVTKKWCQNVCTW